MKEWKSENTLILILFLLVLVGIVVGINLVHHLDSRKPEHIRVNGEDCVIFVVQDGCSSTGACWSHKEAVCP